jgi:hypothetical protein
MKAPRAVIELSKMVFGNFDQHAWDATQRDPFASMAKINELRKRHGQPELTPEQYADAHEAYYKKHPDAKRRKNHE